MIFLRELKKRNPLLYWFGWYNLAAFAICFVFIYTDHTQVLGINRWIKPSKFFLSVGITIWTMNWFLYYLDNKKAVRLITTVFIITLFTENAIISLQAARGVRSHFNLSNTLDGILFGIMGIFIVVFTLACVYVLILFFRQRQFAITSSYCWGIRLGLLLFILFSAQGGWMVGVMAHTVGGLDGGPGFPFLNWSTRYGDLRIAHFFGIHALQVLPLTGYYIAKNKIQVIVIALLYLLFVLFLLARALYGIPFVGGW